MNFLILGDAFPPMQTSGALMLKDLAVELVSRTHSVTVLIPQHSQEQRVSETFQNDVRVISVRALKTKDISYLRRLIAEFINPFYMWLALYRSQFLIHEHFDLLIWYSPSIFWGPLVRRLKKSCGCKSYLVLRDIFPDWARDVGLIKKMNPIYLPLKIIAQYQYDQADVIGVQSPKNREYIVAKYPKLLLKVEVLWNWLLPQENYKEECPIILSKTILKNKKVLVYAGNIGVAQGADSFLKIIQSFRLHDDVGFVFVGRGSEFSILEGLVKHASLKNVLFFPQILHNHMPNLYAQCHAGLLALDARHSTHNIPGKFVSYIQSGLPIMGVVNKGNDLIDIVRLNKLGVLGDRGDTEKLELYADQFYREYLVDEHDRSIVERCKKVSRDLFSTQVAVASIIAQSFKNS
jgi:glycosyltransferase involved in cell wall biosynthesis